LNKKKIIYFYTILQLIKLHYPYIIIFHQILFYDIKFDSYITFTILSCTYSVFWFYYDLRYTLNRLLNYFVMTTHLKISVHNTLFVHIIHSSQHLADQMGRILFSVRTLLHYAVEQLSSSYPAKVQKYLAIFQYHYT